MSLSQTVVWVPVSTMPKTVGKYMLAHINGDTADGSLGWGNGFGVWIWKGRMVDPEEITHWALPLRHPAEMQAEEDRKCAESAADYAKHGPRCSDCGAPTYECECN